MYQYPKNKITTQGGELIMEEKLNIGISFRGHENKIGPVIGIMVVYTPAFLRKFSFLKILTPDKLTILELNKVVEMTQKSITDFRVSRIEAVDMKDKELFELELRHTSELLNSQFKFWKHNIHINVQNDIPRENYLTTLKTFMPHNLKQREIKWDKWIIAQENPKKPCIIADCYAKYLLNIEHNNIKSVWGDFGTGLESDPKTQEFIELNPRCPAIRGREFI